MAQDRKFLRIVGVKLIDANQCVEQAVVRGFIELFSRSKRIGSVYH